MRTVTVPLTVAKTATGARILEGFSAFRDRAVAGSRVRYRRAGRAQALAGASDASRTAPWAGGAERRHTGATFSVSARVARGATLPAVFTGKVATTATLGRGAHEQGGDPRHLGGGHRGVGDDDRREVVAHREAPPSYPPP